MISEIGSVKEFKELRRKKRKIKLELYLMMQSLWAKVQVKQFIEDLKTA